MFFRTSTERAAQLSVTHQGQFATRPAYISVRVLRGRTYLRIPVLGRINLPHTSILAGFPCDSLLFFPTPRGYSAPVDGEPTGISSRSVALENSRPSLSCGVGYMVICLDVLIHRTQICDKWKDRHKARAFTYTDLTRCRPNRA